MAALHPIAVGFGNRKQQLAWLLDRSWNRTSHCLSGPCRDHAVQSPSVVLNFRQEAFSLTAHSRRMSGPVLQKVILSHRIVEGIRKSWFDSRLSGHQLGQDSLHLRHGQIMLKTAGGCFRRLGRNANSTLVTIFYSFSSLLRQLPMLSVVLTANQQKQPASPHH